MPTFTRPSTSATPHYDFEGRERDTLACHQEWPKLEGAKISEDSTLADALVEGAGGKTDQQQQSIYILVERLPTTVSTSGSTAPYSTSTGALGERGEAKTSQLCPSAAISTAATLSTSPAYGDRTTSPSTHRALICDPPISSTRRGVLDAVEVYATPESTSTSFGDLTGSPSSSTAQPTGYEQPQDGTRTGAVEPIEGYDTPVSTVTHGHSGGSTSSTFSTPRITPAEGWGEVETGELLAYSYLEMDTGDHPFDINLGESEYTAVTDPWTNREDQLYVPEADEAQEDLSYIPIGKWPAHPTTSLQQPLYEAEEHAAVMDQSQLWPAQGIGSLGNTHEPYNQLPEFQPLTPEMSQSAAPGAHTIHSPHSVAGSSSWGESTPYGRQYVFRFYRPPHSTAERAAWVAPRHAPPPKQRKRRRRIEGIISIGVRDRAIRERCVFKGVSVDVLDGDSMEGWGRRNDIMLQRYEGEYQPCVLEFKYRQHGQAIRVDLNETNDTIRVRDLARMIARHFGRWCRESDAQRRAVCQQLGHPSDQSGVCECDR
ncbi:hypothetical protein GLOTRDRAFT_133871 [Gloeophyllum trabeum ATCC 11539]|uniref:Uncharacterized protein n=1 Tax=Gloeophyllum trabeum (strain ATCC 11539 / FP-39264 / Madison 617) TaxID=670483 RepID=S7PT06_GLOTA|nr:uncharacterized protein GLOTRDRAFT_133871 [Gloeophyllum trabeum ATCC 11539]EPQ50498.1 hypothetical protein GLOTRDRAFT_133871 [Gloeophyllum trabeum ATCC 11539]